MNAAEFRQRIGPLIDRLYRFAGRILSRPADAEDALQEVLIKLWNHRDQLAAIQNLEAWALRLTRNLCLDKVRAAKVQPGPWPADWDAVDHQEAPDRSLEKADQLQHLQQMMARLPQPQRLVMQLRDIEGLSYQEIAEVLELPLPQVKTNLFRARQKMREWLLASTATAGWESP